MLTAAQFISLTVITVAHVRGLLAAHEGRYHRVLEAWSAIWRAWNKMDSDSRDYALSHMGGAGRWMLKVKDFIAGFPHGEPSPLAREAWELVEEAEMEGYALEDLVYETVRGCQIEEHPEYLELMGYLAFGEEEQGYQWPDIEGLREEHLQTRDPQAGVMYYGLRVFLCQDEEELKSLLFKCWVEELLALGSPPKAIRRMEDSFIRMGLSNFLP